LCDRIFLSAEVSTARVSGWCGAQVLVALFTPTLYHPLTRAVLTLAATYGGGTDLRFPAAKRKLN
jgi:hypothetical protein